MTRKIRYPVGWRVIDRKTKERGIVVHVFRGPMLADVVSIGTATPSSAAPQRTTRRQQRRLCDPTFSTQTALEVLNFKSNLRSAIRTSAASINLTSAS